MKYKHVPDHPTITDHWVDAGSGFCTVWCRANRMYSDTQLFPTLNRIEKRLVLFSYWKIWSHCATPQLAPDTPAATRITAFALPTHDTLLCPRFIFLSHRVMKGLLQPSVFIIVAG